MNPLIPLSQELPGMSFSKWKRLRSCWRQFYENHLRPQSIEIVVTPSDNTKAFIGSAVQLIMTDVINNRLYKTHTFDQLCELIDSDLKLLKQHMQELKHTTVAPDGMETFPIEGAQILTKIQKCVIETNSQYIIWVAMNSLIKKIRDMYKEPLKFFITHPDVDLLTCEVAMNEKSAYFKHKGEVDFVFDYPEYLVIWDGKKSMTSYVDNDQLFHYKLMGEIKHNKPVKELAWYIWDENKIYPVEHQGSTEDLLFRMKNRWDYLVSKNWLDPDDYPIVPSYTGCMYCIINDNCIGNKTSKEEESYI